MEVLLVTLGFLIIYTYFGYGILLKVLLLLRRKVNLQKRFNYLPKVTLLIAAYNEEDIIKDKIMNTLKLEYPKDRLKIVFVTDGSTDRTTEIIKAFPQLHLEHRMERKGKIHAVNRVMPQVKSPVTIFSDANVMLNEKALLYLVQPFSRPEIGAVSGEKQVWSSTKDMASAAGEGIYWRYESKVKQMEADYYTLIGAAGELFAIRTKLYESLNEDTVIEDFALTLNIAIKGYKVAYEPRSVALETSSASMQEEEKRKIRISYGGLQAITRFKSLLNIFKWKKLSFLYISHRVLRWTITPLSLPFAFILNMMLINSSIFWNALFAAQVTFYVLAAFGAMMQNWKIKYKPLFIPYYFTFMNVCVYKGWLRFIMKSQSVVWDKAKRASGETFSVQQH